MTARHIAGSGCTVEQPDRPGEVACEASERVPYMQATDLSSRALNNSERVTGLSYNTQTKLMFDNIHYIYRPIFFP
jgi:hypothetical protein